MKFAFALLAAFGIVGASCGSPPSTFPEVAECAQPAPLPTARGVPGTVSTQSYVNRLRNGADTLAKLRADLRLKYADDTFYRRESFRPDFATYADQTICGAQAMLDLSAPDTRFAEFESKLDVTLNDLIEHTRAGREAVRARNVSDYRKWYRESDAKVSAVRDAAYAQR
ncbi:MAG: hypothetical protein ABI577_13385 [bacterium]